MKKILIVEDEETNSKILDFHVKSFFETIDMPHYKIDVATNGYEALGMHFNYQYDLILLDVKMPKCDGLKFLSILRQNKDSLFQPIVSMVTAMGEEGYVNLFRQKGANSFLIKPYNKEKIFMILEHAFKIKIEKKEDGKIEVKEEENVTTDFDFDFDEFDEFATDEELEEIEEANKTHIKISAQEFLKDYDNIDYILEDVEDIDLVLDILINSLDSENIDEYKNNIDECLRKYATFLNSLASFGELSKSITILNSHIQSCIFNLYDEKKKFYIVEIIRSIIEDLQNWKEFVFIHQNAQDVYYINASILSNSIQLEKMLEIKE